MEDDYDEEDALADLDGAVYIHPEDDVVTLPVGLEIDGTRYRRIRLDELSGVDEENMSDKKVGRNGAKALSKLLRRSIQEIDGLMRPKKDPNKLCPPKYVTKMYQVDRDFLLVAIRIISLEHELEMNRRCGACRADLVEYVDLTKLPVTMWPEDKDAEIEFTLRRGVTKKGVTHKEGVLGFPTGAMQESVALLAEANPAKAQTALLAACIKNLGTIGRLDTETVRRMRSSDRQAIGSAILEHLPGIRLQADFVCDACGVEAKGVRIDLSGFFASMRRSAKRG